tara:strand:+ start:1677 stop:1850 length:174 start_codon:yes stop_codon:yes gene_type:complete
MKVGDLVIDISTNSNGTVLDFPPATHSKEWQKVKVFTQEGLIEYWNLQCCEVINACN